MIFQIFTYYRMAHLMLNILEFNELKKKHGKKMLMSLFSFTFCSLFIFLLIRTHYNIKLLSYIKAKGDLNETKYKRKIVHHRSSNVNIRIVVK